MTKSPTTELNAANAAQALDDFIKRAGSHVEGALYRLVCDRNHPSRIQIDKALNGGPDTSMVVLGPLLISEYKFQFMNALQVASFAGQQVAARGLSALCADLTARRTKNAKALAPIHTPPPTVDLTLDDIAKLKTKSYTPTVKSVVSGNDEHAIELTAEDLSPVITKSSRLVKRVPKPKLVEPATEPTPVAEPVAAAEKPKRKYTVKAKAKTKTKAAVKKAVTKKKAK
jgi:hypothetical protein